MYSLITQAHKHTLQIALRYLLPLEALVENPNLGLFTHKGFRVYSIAITDVLASRVWLQA